LDEDADAEIVRNAFEVLNTNMNSWNFVCKVGGGGIKV
jgi:hypothetical protein